MDRKGRIQSHILMACMSIILAGCQTDETDMINCRITFDSGSLTTRSMDPEENLVTDIRLMIFDERGDAEKCLWLKNSEESIDVELIKGKSYSFRACANFGYQVYADHIDELKEITYHMVYPDEYREGIPMYAEADNIRPSDDGLIRLKLIRLMSKITLKMDRSRLSEDVEMYVRHVKIGNCPKSVKVFGRSAVSSEDQCFTLGFSRDEYETYILNTTVAEGMSGELTLYMMENAQGRMEENDPRADLCSYIEMELDYNSRNFYSSTPLIYRFHIGDGGNDRSVERNCHYRITVCPEDNGLSNDGWHVDKEGITYAGPTSLVSYPSSYINGNIGDKVHVWCELTPPDAPFDVGISYMEEDRINGIYDYLIDEDGHGATLTFTGPGSGLIYMEAGEPINDAALFYIEVNLPKDNRQYETQSTSPTTPVFPQTRDFHHRLQPPGRGQ